MRSLGNFCVTHTCWDIYPVNIHIFSALKKVFTSSSQHHHWIPCEKIPLETWCNHSICPILTKTFYTGACAMVVGGRGVLKPAEKYVDVWRSKYKEVHRYFNWLSCRNWIIHFWFLLLLVPKCAMVLDVCPMWDSVGPTENTILTVCIYSYISILCGLLDFWQTSADFGSSGSNQCRTKFMKNLLSYHISLNKIKFAYLSCQFAKISWEHLFNHR